MSNVMGLHATGAGPPGPPLAAHQRVRAAGRLFKRLFTVLLAINAGSQVLLALLTLLFVTVIWTLGLHLAGPDLVCNRSCLKTVTVHGGGLALFAHPPATILLYSGVIIGHAVPSVLILWRLRALCRLYEQGVVFSRDNVRHIRWIGAWLIVWAACPSLAHWILSAARADIKGYYAGWAGPAQLDFLVIGAVVFLVAQVMQAGGEIEEDRSTFI